MTLILLFLGLFPWADGKEKIELRACTLRRSGIIFHTKWKDSVCSISSAPWGGGLFPFFSHRFPNSRWDEREIGAGSARRNGYLMCGPARGGGPLSRRDQRVETFGEAPSRKVQI